DVKTIYEYDYRRKAYVTCYSRNLHIYSSEELEKEVLVEKDRCYGIDYMYFEMENIEDESFYPWAVPRILLSIHSPFVPVSTLEKGELLRLGHLYSINIRMSNSSEVKSHRIGKETWL
ncbi:hypothetical protein NPIL_524351, partial [Nephila pilipes]